MFDYQQCEKCPDNYQPEREFNLSCDHKICFQCLYKLFEENTNNQIYKQYEPSCPICQQEISLEIVKYVTDDQPYIIEKIKQWKQQQQYIFMDKIDFPQQWDPQYQNCIVVPLQQINQEYILVSQEFKRNMPLSQLICINRIQNMALWKNYEQEKQKLLQYKNSIGVTNFPQNCNEKLLWHGTKRNNPKKIYEAQLNGFNVSFSAAGSRGKGIYFACKSSYSAGNYKYVNEQNNFVILLCKVLLGEVYRSGNNNQLMKPPIKDNNNVQRGNYDSVSDQTETEMYILYGMDCRRAYPAYEVVFK